MYHNGFTLHGGGTRYTGYVFVSFFKVFDSG